jgi:8-oxo-dGTP pyrophosphatase MutT (NUDIX family)
VNTRIEISAGGVIYRRRHGSPDVCLISTQGGQAWQLPKGIIERGELPEDAARRELAEETGLQGELVQRLDRIEYWYVWDGDDERTRIHKFVYFFLFLYTGGSTVDHDHEVDEARWFPLEEAQVRLSFENERRVLGIAAGQILAEEVQAG